jgi:5-formaminoimidazole-4-carboxamide-1-(beta)-D-ribofuranosyl 5'-monophosphate synthetase
MSKKSLPTIVTLGSHSALDVSRGAKDEGFSTLVIAQQGREKTYAEYYKTKKDLGCVDECIVLPKFKEILTPEVQKKLQERNALFVPNRSFEAYLDFDYKAIEDEFHIPMFGNKFLLKIEERNARPNQYDLLKEANIRYPKHFDDPKKIDRLCIIKVAEKERTFERAFFLAKNYQEYQKIAEEMITAGKITQEALRSAVIEEFVVGAQVNFNFFYSVIHERVELLGTDTRRQTNLDGLLRLPGPNQAAVLEQLPVSYEEAGHVAVTVLESLLEPAFAMAESFVQACKKIYAPGIIGPFALQSIVTAGPPKKEIIVIDVSPRMPGSPGISATPYSKYLYGESMSVGRRVAKEIKEAIEQDRVSEITS